jgi:S1-C subfamily serine protease
VNWLDWVAVAIVVLSTLAGFRRGLVAGALSLVGLIGGAVIGARIAPSFVGEGSRFIPIVALGGAVTGSMLGQMLGGIIGGWARRSLWVVPPLRIVDSLGGVVLGALTGLAGVWVLGTVLLYVPGEDDLRRYTQESRIVSSLTSAVPAERVMDALGKIDPFLTLVGPSSGADDPDPSIVRDPDVRLARDSVVRIRGIACGVGIEGSGWIAGAGLVVTNAHVVAGISNPLVDRGGGRALRGIVVAFDPGEDVAVVRVAGLKGRALKLGASGSGAPAAVLGFPGNGPYVARPARVGRTATVTSRDAYGRIRLARTVVAFRGQVEGGSSGGPLVDAHGDVAATVFARRRASSDGYAVPNDLVREVLKRVGSGPVASECSER